ncbi:MAG: hypothetical protein H0T92_03575 [Pyrinomonadaceae bacterium]|nr:hypothetical protein [Pyrinomonadaceae bacterium]
MKIISPGIIRFYPSSATSQSHPVDAATVLSQTQVEAADLCQVATALQHAQQFDLLLEADKRCWTLILWHELSHAFIDGPQQGEWFWVKR